MEVGQCFYKIMKYFIVFDCVILVILILLSLAFVGRDYTFWNQSLV